jgi:hypothetical protein
VEVSTPTIEFTAAEREEYERRQHEYEKLVARLAATETLEQQEQLADELCPRFDAWIRGRNRIQAVRRTRTRPVAVRAPRRTNSSSGRPRAQAARSSAASGDSPDGEPGEPEPAAAPVRRLDLRDLHDRVRAAHSHAASARALLRDDTLGVARLEVAIDVLDALLADLRWGGVPA